MITFPNFDFIMFIPFPTGGLFVPEGAGDGCG